MEQQIKLLDIVALLEDLSSDKLRKGDMGTVVEIFDNGFVEVEFSDKQGVSHAFVDISKEKLLLLHDEPASVFA